MQNKDKINAKLERKPKKKNENKKKINRGNTQWKNGIDKVMNKNGNSGSSGNEYDNNVRKKNLSLWGSCL